jgi:hypothetical protein
MEENKLYYTPKKEELHPGFKYEALDPVFKVWVAMEVDTEFNEGSNPLWFPMQNNIRVKYLDKSDIESEGFIQVGNMSDGEEAEYHKYISDKEDFYTIDKSFDNQYEICFEECSGNMNQHSNHILFKGTIKNKSELITLLSQLGIK